MDTLPLQEAVNRNLQLEDIEQHLAESSEGTRDLFESARRTGETTLIQLCTDRDILEVLISIHTQADEELGELNYLETSGLVDQAAVDTRRQALTDRLRANPEFRLAERILGKVADDQPLEPNKSPQQAEIDPESRDRTLKFLSRDPGILANKLIGMTLVANGRTAVINDVQPQYPQDNQRWIERPIFGPDRVDAFVSSYRGHSILFLRAGTKAIPDCCVKITGITVNGAVHDKQSYVPSALGLEALQTGDLELDVNETELQLVNIKSPKPKD